MRRRSVWNDGTLGFFEERRPSKKYNRASSDTGSVPDQKVK